MNPKIDNGKVNIQLLVEQKHQEYVLKSKRYAFMYYSTRQIGGLCAGIFK